MAIAVDATADELAQIDAELVELRKRLAVERQRGNDGEAAWTRLLIDEALDRRLTIREAS